MELSEDQKVVYRAMEKWIRKPTPTFSVGGYAGTGKTQLLGKFITDNADRMRIACAAFTGKAANVLSQKLGKGIEVTTLHRLLYTPWENEDKELRFRRKGQALLPFDVIVIDEASMLSDRMLDDLLAYRIPILAIGDHGQLPPIGDTGSIMAKPDVRLEKIHRQAESSPIIIVASHLRQTGKFPLPLPPGVVHQLESPFRIGLRKHVMEASLDDLYNTAILCYTNRSRKTFNKIVREMRWGKEVAATGPQVGDVVICLKNMHDIQIFNGMRGIIEDCKKRPRGPYTWMRIRFPDDRNKVYAGDVITQQFERERTFANLDELVKECDVDREIRGFKELPAALFDYGYSMTVHKSQGSQFDTVYLVLEFMPRDDEERMMWRRWSYTGVTRCVKNLTLVERR